MKKLISILMLLVLVSIGFALESTLTFKGGVSQAHQLNGMIGLSYEIWMAKWLSIGVYPYITRFQAGEESAVTNVGTEEVPVYIPNNFKTNVAGGDLLLRLRPHWNPIAPYITGGVGLTNFFPKDLNNHHISGYPDSEYDYTSLVAPTVGAGLMIFTKHGIDFELGFQKNFVMSDYLDGWKTGDDNDSYWMAFLGVSHTFGKGKKIVEVEPEPEPEPVVEVPEPILTVAPNSHKVGWQAGAAKTRVEANNAWNATTNASWIHINPKSGNGNAMLDIMYDENPAYEARSGKIFISSADLNQTITVWQDAKPIPPLVLKPVYFDFDMYALTPAAIATLDEVLASMAYYPETKLLLSGNADEKGSLKYNQKLSEKRADAVKQYLVSKGIPAERFSTIGYGKTKPIADNKTEEGRAMNRRTDLTLQK
jgi:outer membrane protein OmpA-like peptidoglycan-associated protein